MSNKLDTFKEKMSSRIDNIWIAEWTRQVVDTLLDIAATWSFWDRPPPPSITERHLRALDGFYEAFPHANEAMTVTMENFREVFAGQEPAP